MVTIKQASERLNISEQTVRRRLHSGQLQGWRESDSPNAEWRVELPDDLPAEESGPNGEVVKALNDVVEMLRRELDAKNEQITQLHVLLRETARALPAPPGDSKPWWKFWG